MVPTAPVLPSPPAPGHLCVQLDGRVVGHVRASLAGAMVAHLRAIKAANLAAEEQLTPGATVLPVHDEERLLPSHTEVVHIPYEVGAPYPGIFIFTQVRVWLCVWCVCCVGVSVGDLCACACLCVQACACVCCLLSSCVMRRSPFFGQGIRLQGGNMGVAVAKPYFPSHGACWGPPPDLASAGISLPPSPSLPWPARNFKCLNPLPQAARMIRPVKQIASGAAELIGGLEQNTMSIRMPDGGEGGTKGLRFTHTGVSGVA
jgi:hypothetical protein